MQPAEAQKTDDATGAIFLPKEFFFPLGVLYVLTGLILAVVRGVPADQTIDYPLKELPLYRTDLKRAEPLEVGDDLGPRRQGGRGRRLPAGAAQRTAVGDRGDG